MRLLLWLLGLVVGLLPGSLHQTRAEDSEVYTVVVPNGRPYKFERKGRLVAIGDIHGDPDALLAILEDAGLIERDGREILWKGGKDIQLVMMGDVVGKGDRSGDVLNTLMQIHKLMKREGAEFHMVLGNHEIRVLNGIYEKLSPADVKRLEKLGKLKELFGGEGAYGKWLAQWSAILQIGDEIFMHAGIEEWALRFTPAELNATVDANIAHWHGRGPQPPKSTRWAVGMTSKKLGIDERQGPIFTEALKPAKPGQRADVAERSKLLRRWLDAQNARRMYMGHVPTPDSVGPHPDYGDIVWLLDTGNSEAVDGNLSYLSTDKGRQPKGLVRVKRPDGAHPFRKAGCLKVLRALAGF